MSNPKIGPRVLWVQTYCPDIIKFRRSGLLRSLKLFGIKVVWIKKKKKDGRVVSLDEGHASMDLDRKCNKCGHPTILDDGGWEYCSNLECNNKSRSRSISSSFRDRFRRKKNKFMEEQAMSVACGKCLVGELVREPGGYFRCTQCGLLLPSSGCGGFKYPTDCPHEGIFNSESDICGECKQDAMDAINQAKE